MAGSAGDNELKSAADEEQEAQNDVGVLDATEGLGGEEGQLGGGTDVRHVHRVAGNHHKREADAAHVLGEAVLREHDAIEEDVTSGVLTEDGGAGEGRVGHEDGDAGHHEDEDGVDLLQDATHDERDVNQRQKNRDCRTHRLTSSFL